MGALSGEVWRRRPCFWAALGAAAAITAAWEPGLPGWAWWLMAALSAGCLALPAAGLRAAAGLLLVASAYGGLAALALSPVRDPGLREGSPLTVRGQVIARGPASGEERPGVVAARWRLAPEGWVPARGRYGVRVPAETPVGTLVELSGTVRRPLPSTAPGLPSRRLEWLRRGCYFTLHPHARGYRVLGRASPGPLRAWADITRERILAQNRATLSPLAAFIANSFLLGDDEPDDPGLADRVTESFRASGTVHLLVVSGTQVSLVLGPFLWAGARLRRARWLLWLAGAVALCAYLLLTAGDAPVLRAGVMGGILVAGRALDRETDGENCLGLAVLLLLAAAPLSLFDLGFQLSFMAVWGLVRLSPVLSSVLGIQQEPEGGFISGAGYLLVSTLAASVAAHLAVAPLLALHFQQSSWSGILANVPMVVVAGWMQFTCLAHALLCSLGIPAAAGAVEWNASALYGWARLFSVPPFGSGSVFPLPPWLLPVCFAGLAAPSVLRAARPRAAAAAACLAAVLFLSERVPALPPRAPTLRALDVGQGDALLLQSPGGAAILVDAGPPQARVPQMLRALRVPALDLALVSHPHLDHIGGLPDVLAEVPVGALGYAKGSAEPPEWREVLAAAKRQGVGLLPLEAGRRVEVRYSSLSVLGPVDASAGSPDADNERSLVVRWDTPDGRFLLPGDAEEDAERSLLRWGGELRADVLKVSHHGSNGSSARSWLRAVAPDAAVISCGRGNRYGHPGAGTLQRLLSAGIPVARTDQLGMITVTVRDGRPEVRGHLRDDAD